MLLQIEIRNNELRFGRIFRQQNVAEADFRKVLDLQRFDQQAVERQLPVGPSPIGSQVRFFRSTGHVASFVIPYCIAIIEGMVIDAIDPPMYDHRLTVNVE